MARLFLIYDTERSFDERVCRDAADVRDTIKGADLAIHHFTVLEIDASEGTSRDVTSDFWPEETEDELSEREQEDRIFARMWDRHVASFSRPSGY